MGFLERGKKIAKSVARGLAIAAIAATGVGIFYLLAKTYIVRTGERGQSYDNGKLVILPPGRHLLLSPFHEFTRAVPAAKDIAVPLEFEVLSANGISTQIKMVYFYRIGPENKPHDQAKTAASAPTPKMTVDESVEAAINNVGDYEADLRQKVQGDVSTIFQQLTFENIRSLYLFGLRQNQEEEQSPRSHAPKHHNESPLSSPDSKTSHAPSPLSASSPEIKHAQRQPLTLPQPRLRRMKSVRHVQQVVSESSQASLFDDIKDWLNETTQAWGITVFSMRLVSVEAKDPAWREQMESKARAKAAAKTTAYEIRKEARAERDARIALAEGDAQAIAIMAAAKSTAIQGLAEELKMNPADIFRMQNELEQTRALGATTGSLYFGSSPMFAQRLAAHRLRGGANSPADSPRLPHHLTDPGESGQTFRQGFGRGKTLNAT